jgi:hypothetical protein
MPKNEVSRKRQKQCILSSRVHTASRLGVFYQQGTGQWPHVWGCRRNCSDRPARVSLYALCARLSCSLPTTSGNSARIHCRRQCIRALCEAATWIAVTIPGRLRRFAPYKGSISPSARSAMDERHWRLSPPCAALQLSPHEAAGSLFPCWSCEAWSRTDRCVRLGAKRPVWGLGEPQQACRDVQKDIPVHCLRASYCVQLESAVRVCYNAPSSITTS